ncbi:MAG: putative methyltransferase, type 11 [Gemmatimonadetes bacterium]|nr:putative methyltransferase, type 11 [Gemmatimonadota bacterium]
MTDATPNPPARDHSEFLSANLVCSRCKGELRSLTDGGRSCTRCGVTYPLGPVGQPDMRLTSALTLDLPTTYDPLLTQVPDAVWALPHDVSSRLDGAAAIVGRPQQDILAWMVDSIGPGDLVVDLGSKSNRDMRIVEGLGARYLAIEINAPDAMVLGDAHAIPLRDHSVDVLLCMSVFEHLKNPFLAAREIRRVLKPGGRLIGIVGFIEAVHGLPHGSYLHHSYLGIYTVLTSSGFEVKYLHPGWHAIHSIARAILPGIPKRVANALAWPVFQIHSFLYFLYGLKKGDVRGVRLQKMRVLAAGVHFVAVNPGATSAN